MFLLGIFSCICYLAYQPINSGLAILCIILVTNIQDRDQSGHLYITAISIHRWFAVEKICPLTARASYPCKAIINFHYYSPKNGIGSTSTTKKTGNFTNTKVKHRQQERLYQKLGGDNHRIIADINKDNNNHVIKLHQLPHRCTFTDVTNRSVDKSNETILLLSL